MIVGGIPMLFGGVGGPWSFVAASTPTATGANPIAVLPTGYATGDLLIIVGTTEGTFSTPAGWTARLLNGGSGSPRLSIWDKIAGASETNVTVTNANNKTSVVMLAYRNINATPLDINGTITTASATTVATASLTTTVANDLVTSIYGCAILEGTWTAPASTTARVSYGGTADYPGFLIVDENKATAGATTARTATLSVSGGLQAFAVSYKQV